MNILDNFIVFEGLDGAGTTTQARLLSDHLTATGRSVFLTCEPTDGPIGRLIREILSGSATVTHHALAMLYAADRHDHLYGGQGMLEQLRDHDLVISDRYFYSSVAYQAVDVPKEDVLSYNAPYPHPMIIIYIDTPVSECLKRIDTSRDSRDIFEHEHFQQAVYENYEQMFSEISEQIMFCRIDGRLPIDQIHRQITSFVDQRMSIASP
jgi:dTMP kinase